MKSSPIPTSRPADRLPRDRRIDLCYVIGILLVVAGHSGVDPRFASTALFRWIYAFHMPLFFALSGYLFRYGGGSGRVGAGTFARRRALRLLLPLVVWTTLVFIPKGLLSAYAMRPSELSFSAYLHAFLYPADNPIRPFWFLEVLFEVSLAGYAVDRIVRSRPAALAAVAGIAHEPAQAKGLAALRADLDRHLIGGAANAASLNFKHGHDVRHRLLKNFHRIAAGFFLDDLKRTVASLLCSAALAIEHNLVDELGYDLATIHGVVKHFALGDKSTSRHN